MKIRCRYPYTLISKGDLGKLVICLWRSLLSHFLRGSCSISRLAFFFGDRHGLFLLSFSWPPLSGSHHQFPKWKNESIKVIVHAETYLWEGNIYLFFFISFIQYILRVYFPLQPLHPKSSPLPYTPNIMFFLFLQNKSKEKNQSKNKPKISQ